VAVMDLNSLAPIRKLDIGILRKTLNSDNISTDESQIKNKNDELLPKIFRLLASLEDDTQKMLLDSWAKMEIPLTEKTVANLLQYLETNPNINNNEKMAIIKAFAFLEINGLPYSEKLINALRSVFNNNGNLSPLLEEFLASNNSLSLGQLNNLLSQLNLNEIKDSIINIDTLSQQNLPIANQQPAVLNSKLDLKTQTAAEQNVKPENINLFSQLLNKYDNLDQELKNIILSKSNNLNQNFNQNTVKVLINFINHNNIESTSEKISLIKAFAFLENNQLPLTENLIKEIKGHFEQNINQFTENLKDKAQIFANLNNNKFPLISKNESAVNLNSNVEQIAKSLAAQSELSDQLLSLFNKIGGENEEKIANNLLGQKLVNLQQKSQNTPLILALEIPIQLKENKLSSLMLKVVKEENNSAKLKDKNSYNISFILEFENIGPIKTKVNVNHKHINTIFFTESAETANLIKDRFERLHLALKEEGFTINNVRIKNLNSLGEEKDDFFNKIILSEINEIDKEGHYTHIDIKI
jgi:hypothetical protein